MGLIFPPNDTIEQSLNNGVVVNVTEALFH